LTPFEDSSCPWTEEFSKSLNLKYHPRGYQIEIIRDAIRNGNTIVCLRTGSGKTFIASILIKYHFIKRRKANPDANFLALFFVPRKAIRLQQATAVNDIGNLRVRICEDDQTVDQILNNHVIVSTPQKFLNCLKQEKLFLSQIDLMIFDECHNTSGGNPYCEIMKFYLCPSRKQSTGGKPLMIGLTATISAKDSSEKKESVEVNLISICSKLACRTISTVCDPNNIEEINREISRPKNDQFEFVSKVEYNSYFNEYLDMFKALVDAIKRHLTNHEVLGDHEIGSPGFIGQLTLLKRIFEGKGDVDNTIISYYLLLLTSKYSALKDLPFSAVLEYILKGINEYYEGRTESLPINNIIYEHCKTGIETILQKCRENATTNSKLDKLVLLLKRYAPTNSKGNYIFFRKYKLSFHCRTHFGKNNILC
jgi:ERCC4-related helicase